jgi:outer membrane putative beta-barrel porin/alpha-amylase
MSSLLLSFRTLAIAVVAALITTVSNGQEFRYQKALFQWAGSEGAEEEQPESDRIITDRPHFSEASNLVGLGTVQLETGYTFFRNDDGGVKTTLHSFPEPLLRVGVFAEWFEFRLAYNYLIENTITGFGSSRASGSDDIYVGAKLALAKQSGFLPEMAIFPQMRVPTGARFFSSEQVLPGFNLAYSWKLNDWVELECNTQLNRRRDDSEHFYMEFIQTINVEYDLSERWGAFTEWVMFSPCGALTAQTQHYLHGGFVYFPTRNVQLDAHIGMGISQAADDLAFTGVGASFRW